MKLTVPSAEYMAEIDAYRREMLDAGSSMDGTGGLRRMEAREWLALCEAMRRPETTPPGLVPATQFLYVREEDGRVVGMAQVRHALRGRVETIGGHIGYSVRPSERRKGYAKAMLAEALAFCWVELRLERALVTCDAENEASRRTILANGGAYESALYDAQEGITVQRYWIGRPRRLLVTGFEPFGGAAMNPSWEAVKALPERIGNWELARVRLPVVFGEAARQAIAAAESLRADAVLAVGMAGGRGAVTVEKAAINLRHAEIPDNAGNQPQDALVVPGGPDAFFSTLPVRAMARAIAEAGLPGAVSCTAGTYVCNDLMYSLLRRFSASDVRAGFIHVPYADGMGNPSLPLEDITRALEAAIGAMGSEQ